MKLLTKTAWILVLFPFVANAHHSSGVENAQQLELADSVAPATPVVFLIVIAIVVIVGAWWIFKKPRKK